MIKHCESKHSLESEYINLANAIILRAVKDYRRALRKLVKFPDDIMALSRKQEVERFFRSRWFEVLTSIDPEMLIRKLNAEVM